MKSLIEERDPEIRLEGSRPVAPTGQGVVTPEPGAGPALQPWPGASHPPSCAELALVFSRHPGGTRITRREHFGPLRIQKPLYPEGPDICHAVVIHPPGGIVGGDRMHIAAGVGSYGQTLLTTPGAAKWYRANGRTSTQAVQLHVEDGATLEWLPQETIFFDGACVEMQHDVNLAGNAAYIGSEILCFGRTASGETFDSGKIAQRTIIHRDGHPLWFENGRLVADGHADGSGMRGAMHGPLGLAGNTVCATMIAVGDGLTAALVDAIRAEATGLRHGACDDGGSGSGIDGRIGIGTGSSSHPCSGSGGFGVTLMKTVLVARYLGNSSGEAKARLQAVWQHVRPVLIGRDAAIPRIWTT